MVLWFFLIVSWGGSIDIQHGFASFESCEDKRVNVLRHMKQTIRGVTECIAVPIGERYEPPQEDRKRRKEGV